VALQKVAEELGRRELDPANGDPTRCRRRSCATWHWARVALHAGRYTLLLTGAPGTAVRRLGLTVVQVERAKHPKRVATRR
jgi:hypothetical protein